MAGIVFFYEENDIDIFSGRRLDLSAWNYAIKAAGDIDKVIIVNKTNQTINNFDSSLAVFNVVNEIPALEGKIIHLVCPWNKTEKIVPLWNFDHKVDWYIFGPAQGWHSEINIPLGLTIPMTGSAALHSVHIASVVMLHRYGVLKWQHQ